MPTVSLYFAVRRVSISEPDFLEKRWSSRYARVSAQIV